MRRTTRGSVLYTPGTSASVRVGSLMMYLVSFLAGVIVGLVLFVSLTVWYMSDGSSVMVKKWYESRSMWFWAVSAVLLVVLPMVGVDVTPEMLKGHEEQILIGMGVVLRFITGKSVEW